MKAFQSSIKDGCTLGVYVPVPFDTEKEFGKKKVKITGAIDGLPFTGLISFVVPYGNIVVLHNRFLKALDKKVNEEVSVEIYERQ